MLASMAWASAGLVRSSTASREVLIDVLRPCPDRQPARRLRAKSTNIDMPQGQADAPRHRAGAAPGHRARHRQEANAMNIAVKPEAATVEDVNALPIAELNPARTDRFQNDTIWPVFERLRREDPVHFTPQSEFGPYWSLTRWDDIMAVDTDHEGFTSTEGIGLGRLDDQAEMEKVMGGRSRQ